MRNFILILRSNWLSRWGGILTTLAFMAMATSFVYFSLHGGEHGPYSGLFLFIVLPVAFVIGLGMVTAGFIFYRHRLKDRKELITQKPLHLVRLIAILTVINLAVVGTGGYEAVHYMDSTQFCGKVCHEVMSPVYETYQRSAHARVACVECHIGPGASWFVKSKISGLRQVAAVMFDTYEKPIKTPVHDLRPARETCEQCHWPDKFTGDRLVVRQHFGEDEEVTAYANVLVMKTGGIRPDGAATGIHWHVAPGNEVTYVSTDDKRQTIPWVRFTDTEGNERVFTTEDLDPEAPPPEGEMRTMDCVDCHNQPSHAFEEPDRALDEAIAFGLVPRELPYIRKIGLEALEKGWTRETAAEGIRDYLEDHYASNGGLSNEQQALVATAAEAIADIWLRNIYPGMAITWGTYPSFEGHRGCLRCHNGELMDIDGEVISMDCDTCHVILAQRETDPEILDQLGLNGK